MYKSTMSFLVLICLLTFANQSFGQLTSQTLPTTLTGSEVKSLLDHYKKNISAICVLAPEEQVIIFNNNEILRYSNCLTSPKTDKTKCPASEINAAIVKSANKYCNDKMKKAAAAVAAANAEAQKKNSSSKATPAPSALASSASSSTAQPSFGGVQTCVGPGACSNEPPKPTYTWAMPVPFLYGLTMDTFVHQGGGFNLFTQPQAPCDASHQGQLMAVDFGSETKAVVCMGDPKQNINELMDKMKKAKLDSLPTEVAIKNPVYSWVETTKPDPIGPNGFRVCSYIGDCTKENLGAFGGVMPCGIAKCVRTDEGGPVKTKSAKIDLPATDKPKVEPIAVVAPPDRAPAAAVEQPAAAAENPYSNINMEYGTGGGGEGGGGGSGE